MPRRLTLAIALWAFGQAAGAGDLRDPLSVSRLAPSSPLGALAADGGAAPCALPPLTARELALAEVVDRALCNNPQTHQAWASARVQAAQLGVARAAFLPGASATASVARTRVDGRGASTDTPRDAGLALSWLLYDFGQREAAAENARQILAAANASLDATVQTVFLAAVQAYYQVFASRAAVEAARDAEKSSLASLDAASARYRAGVATPADRLQAQTAYSQAVLNRIQGEGNEKVAQGSLANVMGLDANRPVALAPPTAAIAAEEFGRDLDRMIAEARSRRPDLAAAEAQVKAAQASVQSARAAGLPSISLTGNWNYSGSPDNPAVHSSSVGVAVSIPLFSGFATHYRVQSARAQVDSVAAQRDQVRQQVALDVWKAYQTLATQTQAVKTSDDLLASATASERLALGRYRAGVGTILDVLTAQTALASARQQHIQALYGWHIARATLAQAMGRLDFGTLQEPAAPPLAPGTP